MVSMPSGELRLYQAAGCRWIANKLSEPDNKAVLLCDDPGLGKTVQALSAAHALNARRILTVCPAGARLVWEREILKWFPSWHHRIMLIDSMSRARDTVALDCPELFVLLSYDALSRSAGSNQPWSLVLSRSRWDLLILDEAHYLKNLSLRTRAVYGDKGSTAGIQAACDKIILLTGTPAPNHAGELYHHIRTFWPNVLLVPGRDPTAAFRQMTEGEFQERFTEYVDTKYGRQITRSKNQSVLREKLKSIVLHRSKAKVLPELPPVVSQDIPLDMTQRSVSEHLSEASRRFADAFSHNTRLCSDDEFVAQLRRAQSRDLGPLATLRRELGELKVDATADWVTERLECGAQKMLVFGWHPSVLYHLARRLAAFDPVIITGQTTPAGRANAIDLFQTRATVRVFVGQILAAGTAITLTAASEVAIMEPSWVPGENRQAIDRANRLGQVNSVLASFIYVPGTIDERIMAVFRRKAEDIAQLIPNEERETA